MYLLTKDDFDKMKRLLDITTSIAECYINLEDLENKQKKYTFGYQKNLETLKRLIAKEEEIYAEVTSYAKAKAWYGYFDKTLQAFDGDSSVIKMPIERIFNFLINKMAKPEVYNNIEVDIKEASYLLENGLANSLEEAKQYMWKRECFKVTFYKEYSLLALLYMSEYLDNPAFELFRPKMISAKYNMIYLSREVEREMLANNFDVPTELTFNSSFLAFSWGIQDQAYFMLKDALGLEFAMSVLMAFE